uniref:Phosphoribosyltransferase domain-containing protein n=1 Tax=Dictyurus purpurascens TaxID=189649 RepID=A0A4D6WXT9_9FLOR|nr:hypothetical protein [Dictyurus purpurascens]
MQLNIYIVSHPIIKILSNSIIENNKITNISIYNEKYLGFLLIYELMRKYIKINSIYIKKINYVKKIYIKNHNKQHYIITNLIETYKIIGEITSLLPDIKIININTKQNIQQIENLQNITFNTEIIIFDKILKSSWILQIIRHLIRKRKICIENIQIVCLACYNQILDKLGNEYPKLEIYTAKIIY